MQRDEQRETDTDIPRQTEGPGWRERHTHRHTQTDGERGK